MNIQEKIEAWVKALRSGEYKQTQGRMKRTQTGLVIPAGHCCLGVLEEVLEGKVETHIDGVETHIDGKYHGYPTDDFLARQGFIDGDDLDGDQACAVRFYLRELAGKNDQGEPFDEIALFIEHTAYTVLARLEKNNEHS